MNSDKPRNDFIFFQNEILGDVKKFETKIIDKLTETLSSLDNQNEKFENKIKELTSKINLLSTQFEQNNNTQKFIEILKESQQKMEDLVSKIEIKLNILDRDFSNACFKYDKMFSTNLIVPGLIGTSCPYNSLRPFLEYTNQKLCELLKAKDKQSIDSKKYKEKMESIIAQNKTQFETAQKKINDYCNQGFEQCDITCKDRINLIEKRIEALRLENGQFAYDLKQKTEELQIEWEKLNKIENVLNQKYKEEWNKYNNIVDKIGNKVDKTINEFYLIKSRFTELSEFIKDVRFRRNLAEMNSDDINKEKKQFRQLGNRIDFSKKQKIKNSEIIELKKEITDNNILRTYDNNNNNNSNDIQYNEEENKIEKIENTNDNNKINEITNKNENNIQTEKNDNINNKKQNEIKSINNDNINKTQIIDEINNNKKNKMLHNKFYNENTFNNSDIYLNKSQNNKSMNEILNNSSDFQSCITNNPNNNYTRFKQDKDIKYMNIKRKKNDKTINDSNTYNIINYNNDNNSYIINYSRNFNDNRVNNYNYNENNTDNSSRKNMIKGNKEQIKNNLILLAENAKINEFVLGADFPGKNNYNGPMFNLSQAYIIVKKRTEEMKKMKKTNMGRSEPKYHQITPSSSMNHSRNLNSQNHLNNINYYLKKDLKKYNKEDLFHTSLKNDKFKNSNPNQKIIFNLTNQSNFNNLYKNNFPKIFKEKNESTNNPVEFNTININENNFENQLLTQKSRNIKKKMSNSSSDKSLLVKVSPFSPNFNEHFSFFRKNIDEKNKFQYSMEGNVKETLNQINPYLIRKFKDV